MCLSPEQHIVLDRAPGNSSLARTVHVWGMLLMILLQGTPGPESEKNTVEAKCGQDLLCANSKYQGTLRCGRAHEIKFTRVLVTARLHENGVNTRTLSDINL